jgi:two-component system sensor histidine kinase NreB
MKTDIINILIIDDEKSLRITFGIFLKNEGYKVQVCETATKATYLLNKSKFDVILCDMIMPGMSGIELLENIKNRSPETVVIIMTGVPTLETATEALRKGASDYLSKPFDKHTLLKVVKNAVRIKILQDEKRRLEKENKNYQNNLEKLVKKRTQELSIVNSNLIAERNALNRSALVIITNPDHKIEYVNEFYCSVSKYAEKELLGQNSSIITSGYHSSKFFKNLFDLVHKGEIFHGEIKNKAKDGSFYWVQTSISPILEGKINKGYISIQFDITQRKKLEIKALRANIKEQDEIRKSISQEIHDGFGQSLGIASIELKGVKDHIKKLPSVVAEKFINGLDNLNKAIEDSRQLSHILMPAVLKDFGLPSSLEDLIKRVDQNSDIKFSFYTNKNDIRFDQTIEVNIFRIVQEAINNIIKHSNATVANIQLMVYDKSLLLTIEDNGSGFDLDKVSYKEGIGLANISNRVNALNGILIIDSLKGTSITIEIYFNYN